MDVQAGALGNKLQGAHRQLNAVNTSMYNHEGVLSDDLVQYQQTHQNLTTLQKKNELLAAMMADSKERVGWTRAEYYVWFALAVAFILIARRRATGW